MKAGGPNVILQYFSRAATVPIWQSASVKRTHRTVRERVLALAEDGHGASAIGKALGVSRDVAIYYMRRRPTTPRPCRRWTPAEDAMLREHGASAELARLLGRTWKAVEHRARRLGLGPKARAA